MRALVQEGLTGDHSLDVAELGIRLSEAMQPAASSTVPQPIRSGAHPRAAAIVRKLSAR